MKSVPAIDANVILRFLTNDDPEKARAAVEQKTPTIYSYDRDFNCISGILRVEP